MFREEKIFTSHSFVTKNIFGKLLYVINYGAILHFLIRNNDLNFCKETTVICLDSSVACALYAQMWSIRN